MIKTAIFPGTFDPLTLGHQDLILRAAKIFDRLIVAVAVNINKAPLLTLEQRVTLLTKAFAGIPNITVAGYSNLLVDFARQQQAKVIVRSVRSAGDFEYELKLSGMNHAMDNELETVLLLPNSKFAHINSTFVREIAQLGGDVSPFVSPEVAQVLQGIKWR